MQEDAEQTSGAEFAVKIEPSVLRRVRERVGLTHAAAVELVNRHLAVDREPEVPVDRIVDLEAGRASPTLAEAEALARTYLVSFSDLLGTGLQLRQIKDFRLGPDGRRGQLSYETRTRLHEFDRVHQVASRISEALGMTVEDISVPSVRVEHTSDLEGIEAAGRAIRRALGIDDATQSLWKSVETALAAVRARVEMSGVFVTVLSLPLNECRGASLWERGGPPSILVNASDSQAAQLFTLLHEYAHLAALRTELGEAICDPAAGREAGGTPERVANRIAAAALVPQSLLDIGLPLTLPPGAFSEWPSKERRRLSRIFSVSEYVIGLRLFHLGRVATFKPPRGFWRLPSTDHRGRSMARALRYRRAMGARGVELAAKAVANGLVSPVEIARTLDAKVSDVEKAIEGA